MFWKIILFLIGKRKNDYKMAVKYGKEVYEISIEKFVPIAEELRKWEQAIENQPREERSEREVLAEVPEKLETVEIDIPNKVFNINGKSFGESTEFHMSFEDGEWCISVYQPQRYKGTWGWYGTDGEKLHK